MVPWDDDKERGEKKNPVDLVIVTIRDPSSPLPIDDLELNSFIVRSYSPEIFIFVGPVTAVLRQ